MAKLVILFACVALFQLAHALKCYHCDGPSCEKPMAEWQTPSCGGKPADPNQEQVCLKQIYKDKTSQKETYSRKCVLQNKNEKFKCNNDKGEEVLCETCNTDLCNSSASISLSFVAIAGIFVALLAPKFLS